MQRVKGHEARLHVWGDCCFKSRKEAATRACEPLAEGTIVLGDLHGIVHMETRVRPLEHPGRLVYVE